MEVSNMRPYSRNYRIENVQRLRALEDAYSIVTISLHLSVHIFFSYELKYNLPLESNHQHSIVIRLHEAGPERQGFLSRTDGHRRDDGRKDQKSKTPVRYVHCKSDLELLVLHSLIPLAAFLLRPCPILINVARLCTVLAFDTCTNHIIFVRRIEVGLMNWPFCP